MIHSTSHDLRWSKIRQNPAVNRQGTRSTAAGGGRKLQVASRTPTASSRRGERLSLLWRREIRPDLARNPSSPPRKPPPFKASIRRAPAVPRWRSGRERCAGGRATKAPMCGGLWWPHLPPAKLQPPRPSWRRIGRFRQR